MEASQKVWKSNNPLMEYNQKVWKSNNDDEVFGILYMEAWYWLKNYLELKIKISKQTLFISNYIFYLKQIAWR